MMRVSINLITQRSRERYSPCKSPLRFTSEKMISLKYSEIPVYLHDSDFYQALNPDDPDACFEIPSHCYRDTNEKVETSEDLKLMVEVMKFWGVKCIPLGVLEFCFNHKFAVWQRIVEDLLSAKEDLKCVFPRMFTLESALITGRSELVDFWFSKNGADSEHGKNAFAQACRFGRLDLVQTLHEKGFPWDGYAYCAAAQYGHIEVLRYLHEKGCKRDIKALIHAARGGQIECMKYLHSLGCEWSEDVTIEYALSTHYIRFNLVWKRPWTDNFTILPPANGYFECLRYALENGCPIHEDACTRVCEYGLLDCLKLLHRYEAKWNAGASYAAASFGHLSCLQYLHEHDCPWDCETAANAALQGNLDCLHYLVEHNCPWDDGAVSNATVNGHVSCLQYLHNRGGRLDETLTRLAALYGHLDCLCYLFEQGCPYDENILNAAAGADSMGCLKYLIEDQGLFMNTSGTVFESAFASGKYQNMQYLFDVGCPVRSSLFASIDLNYCCIDDADLVQCIRCATERGLTISKNLLDAVVRGAKRRGKGIYLLSSAYIGSEYDEYGGYLTNIERAVLLA